MKKDIEKLTLDKIFVDYRDSEVVMGEMLDNLPATGLTIGEAFILYMDVMKKCEEDRFFRIADSEILEEYADGWKTTNIKIKENIVSSFFFYMWNAWCKEECIAAFGYEYRHFWEKWCGLTKKSYWGAAEKFYAELSDSYREMLVNRACEVYDGNCRRANDEKATS